ncbi:MAG: hypothetical protein HUU50_22400, partial [Candidatus Brocadiae bacterium]|nr:hypothetical protein [Candidatus Brocadiia bacterium]
MDNSNPSKPWKSKPNALSAEDEALLADSSGIVEQQEQSLSAEDEALLA